MHRFHTSLLAIFILAFSINAQPNTQWIQTCGGIESDFCFDGQQTTDGGFITVGQTASFGNGSADVYLVKVDANGDTVWTKTFGGFSYESGTGIIQTTDGGYIIIGDTFSFGPGDCDIYLIKTDENGNEEWSEAYGGTGRDAGNDVIQTSDNGYILVAETWSYGPGEESIFIIRTDSNGITQWERTFGGSNCDEGFSIRQTSDDGFVIAGCTNSFSMSSSFYDMYLIKTDAFGIEQWSRTYGGSGSDVGHDVMQTPDGGYIITGATNSSGAGMYDVCLLRTDADGNPTWTQTYGGTSAEEGHSVDLTSDNGFIVTGYSLSYSPPGVYLLKTDASGSEEWHKMFACGYSSVGYAVDQTNNEGYFIAGWTNTLGAGIADFLMICLEPEQQYISVVLNPHNPPIQIPAAGGSFTYDIEIANNDSITYIVDIRNDITLPSGAIYQVFNRQGINLVPGSVIQRDSIAQNVPGYALAGDYVYNAYIYDHNTIELLAEDHFPFEKLPGSSDSHTVSNWILTGWDKLPDEYLNKFTDFTINEFTLNGAYPNPFNPTTTISFSLPVASLVKLDVFDINGRNVGAGFAEGTLYKGKPAPTQGAWHPPGTHQITFDGSNLSSGIYIYRLTAEEYTASGKMVLLK
ncbi:hypothetical protein CEE37_01970 [candidate division LCP-89 bacterium B3_LCP]|uniref:Secretion system C-terminal sorting domain-containing protein n=1 Tax=candidate division LCP-89 bacterium B3_LCP TaxID=2012998 RepID=A0A532V5J0_UNCL8|nr:MAG: hypothetical protein CEE37_01970 [candidate division LCP-89 bacterium B3_LCP]